MTIDRCWRAIVACMVLVVGCTNPGDDRSGDPGDEGQAAVNTVSVSRDGSYLVDTIATTESGLVGAVTDLSVHSSGRIFASDGLAHAVHVFGPDGQRVETLGQLGQGPGEFRRPSSVLARGDTLLVVDAGNGRVQVLSLTGGYLSARPVLATNAAPVVGRSGLQVKPTLGLDSILAIVTLPDGAEQARLGTPLAPPTNMISISRLKAEIAEGGVPDIFLNTAFAVVDDGDAVWLLIPAAGRVDRYDVNGNTLFSQTLTEPEFDLAFAAYQEQNAVADARRVVPLEYFRDATMVGEELWILLGTGPTGPAIVLTMSPDGQILQKHAFDAIRGAGQFAFDNERGLAYFAISDTAELLRVETDIVTQ